MLKTRIVTVSTTPTVIASATVGALSTAALTLAGASLYDPVPVICFSPSTQAVYFGGTSMTTATSMLGIPLTGPGFGPSYSLLASDALFAATTNGTVDLTCQAGRQS